jgi:membrane-bound lytic murein transglycosylase D
MRNLSKKAVLICMFFGAFIGRVYPYYNFPDSAASCIDPVICRLDSMSFSLLTREKIFVDDKALEASIDMPADALPKFTDAQIMEKMKLIPSLIPLNYNQTVRQFIEFFAYRRRGFMAQCLANAQIYFPIFEEILDKKGLPLELKYLPIVESALNPAAVSSAGATGLWQLMYSTGSLLGLNINSYIDERRDPIKATEAAADYLKKLYDMYGDWHLVLAAYNSGPGSVNKAIARAGGIKNFWAILPYLPAETRSYVPTYISAVYVMNYFQDFKLVSAEPKRELYAIDTVLITSKVSLKHISDVLAIPVDELQFLNPSVKTGIIPYTQDGFALNLPINYFALFEAMKDDIMNDTSQIVKNFEPVVSQKTIWYRVRSNRETLAQVARKYNVSTAKLRRWNRMRSPYIYAGQRLKIIVPQVTYQSTTYAQVFSTKLPEFKPTAITDDSVRAEDTVAVNLNTTKTDSAKDNTKTNTSDLRADFNRDCGCIYHVVQPGDTLWSIAQHYSGLTVAKLKQDNKSLLDKPIQVGEVLKIFM